ncbi:helix-turn-helix transcriptional regulator [Lysinibacter sp. HNR]|uniref:helix-turn-helix domain-containing protein n=1 Tax=Lysinibacter sp. HNR TaxID=3031408 RepID=UPI0024351DFF|nr:helix-turn-helix transcriptional regulator [Lysinibacter sp. HNR]WGD37401.1 helix-turn-helix transcriptional regulator [Lysinibacter sp. HNR]
MSKSRSEAAIILGSRVLAARMRAGISQMDAADLSSIHFTNFGKIERGESNPTFSTIIRIATALNIDPAVLVEGIEADKLPDTSHQVTAADLIRARKQG